MTIGRLWLNQVLNNTCKTMVMSDNSVLSFCLQIDLQHRGIRSPGWCLNPAGAAQWESYSPSQKTRTQYKHTINKSSTETQCLRRKTDHNLLQTSVSLNLPLFRSKHVKNETCYFHNITSYSVYLLLAQLLLNYLLKYTVLCIIIQWCKEVALTDFPFCFGMFVTL